MEDGPFPSQGLWSLSHKIQFLTPTLTHTKQYPFGAKVPKYIIEKTNVKFEKNNENDAVFDEICEKKNGLDFGLSNFRTSGSQCRKL